MDLSEINAPCLSPTAPIMLSSDRWVFWFPFPAVFLPSAYIVCLPLFIHVLLQNHWEGLLINSIYFSKQSRHAVWIQLILNPTDSSKAVPMMLKASSLPLPPPPTPTISSNVLLDMRLSTKPTVLLVANGYRKQAEDEINACNLPLSLCLGTAESPRSTLVHRIVLPEYLRIAAQ